MSISGAGSGAATVSLASQTVYSVQSFQDENGKQVISIVIDSNWSVHPVLGWMILVLAVLFLAALIAVHFYNKSRRCSDRGSSVMSSDDEYHYYSESTPLDSSVYYTESDGGGGVSQSHSSVFTKNTMSDSSIAKTLPAINLPLGRNKISHKMVKLAES